jgi:hypothetical protein
MVKCKEQICKMVSPRIEDVNASSVPHQEDVNVLPVLPRDLDGD